jgi:hypothetical protein
MRYELLAPWAAGGFMMPAGTIVDFDNPQSFEAYITRETCPPLAAQPLDEEAYGLMVERYRGRDITIRPLQREGRR